MSKHGRAPQQRRSLRAAATEQPSLFGQRQSAPPAVRAGVVSGGRPLDRATRADMEARFGHDFGQVRVHSDAQADASARALGAHAYAYGQDIVFGAGRYAPETRSGRELLAHELAHVVQQASGGAAGGFSRPGDSAELDAASAAAAAMSGGRAQVQVSTGPQVAGFWGDSDPFWFYNDVPELPRSTEIGWGQPGDHDSPGPYAFAKTNETGRLLEFGAGTYHGQGADGSLDAGPSINGRMGEWDTGNENWRWGYSMSATGGPLGGRTTARGDGWQLDAGVGTASFDLNAGTDGFSLGAQANLGEAAATFGSGLDSYSKDDVAEHTARFGLSEGIGLAARGAWGDRDGDGFREYGGGIDIGPISLDLRTEDPLGDLASLIPYSDSFLPSGENTTEAVANLFGLSTKNADLGTTWDLLTSPFDSISLPSFDDILPGFDPVGDGGIGQPYVAPSFGDILPGFDLVGDGGLGQPYAAGRDTEYYRAAH